MAKHALKSDSNGSAPVRSMTGYGRALHDGAQSVSAEIRSVNGRFFKLNIKILGRYAALEDRIKSMLSESGIKRGSVDVSIYFESASESDEDFGLNEIAIRAYALQAKKLAKKNKLKSDLPISALLPLPGVIKRRESEDDLDSIWGDTKKAMEKAIVAFNQMRDREGEAMAADVRAQMGKLAEHRTAIQIYAPDALKNTIQKFKDRIAKLLQTSGVNAPLNPDVVEREVVVMSDRTDVSEELARLESHFQQMESTLKAGGETGKKLDFLTQELFRETNTIGSKVQDERITHIVVDMKGLIEKIREQVQNLE